MHGVSRSVTFSVEARYTGSTIEVSGSIPVLFSNWDIANPSFGPVTTQSSGTVEFLLDFIPERRPVTDGPSARQCRATRATTQTAATSDGQRPPSNQLLGRDIRASCPDAVRSALGELAEADHPAPPRASPCRQRPTRLAANRRQSP